MSKTRAKQAKPSQQNGYDPKLPPAPKGPLKVTVGNLPMHTCQPGFTTTLANFRMTRRQAAVSKWLACSMSDAGDRFRGGRSSHSDGTTVESANDALRRVLDMIGDAAEANDVNLFEGLEF